MKKQNSKLRLLPPVHEIVTEITNNSEVFEGYDLAEITWVVRKILEKAREFILNSEKIEDNVGEHFLIEKREKFWEYPAEEFSLHFRQWLKREIHNELENSGDILRRVVNATGVVLHTNCGRALLAPEVAKYVAKQAMGYSNLELDIATGNRGSRYFHVEKILSELTGAEASLVVNNNAAAVLLIMNTFAKNKEVIVSRGELVEVGGSFRIPEVLKAGGAKLVEVGATNKTWIKDYEGAVGSETALFLKVHTSNYRIEGFKHSVSLEELVKLGDEMNIPVVEDLGSGSFLDGVEYGLPQEPTIQEAVKTGVSLVTFSGDKLLGGPQAGIIVGKKEFVDKLKTNQLTRAVRVDKLTLAALVGTFRLYQRGEINKIPVWHMLSKEKAELQQAAERLQESLAGITTLNVEIQDNGSCVGGGAFPTAVLPTTVCAVKPLKESVDSLERFLRQARVPILARIVKDRILFDPRTLLPEDYEEIVFRLQEWETK